MGWLSCLSCFIKYNCTFNDCLDYNADICRGFLNCYEHFSTRFKSRPLHECFQSKTKTWRNIVFGFGNTRNSSSCLCLAHHIHGVRKINGSARRKAHGKVQQWCRAIGINPKLSPCSDNLQKPNSLLL